MEKMAKVFLLSFAFILFHFTIASVDENSKESISKAINSLEEEDREDFLSYLLGLSLLDWARNQPRPPRFFSVFNEDIFLKSLNIPEKKIQAFQKMNIPAESRKKLLNWTERDFGLNKKDVLDLVRTKKCQSPNCISLGEIGPLCCPW